MPNCPLLRLPHRFYFLVLFQTILGLTIFLLPACEKKETKPSAPPLAVEVANVVQQNVPVYHRYVGTTDGLVNATIRAEVEGYLIKQNYEEGSFVKKGQVLFEIDPRPFQAALEQAKAQLAQNEGSYFSTKTDLEKILPLAELNAVSKKDRDDAIGQERAAQAAVLASKAIVQKAEIDLSFTKILSPIDGIAGIATAQIGDLVGTAASSELTTVSTVNPIKVYIPVSEQQYLEYIRAQEGHEISGFESFVFQMILADGSLYKYLGKFYFADRQVDPLTGTIKVAVLFPNPGNVLRPGQFARVSVLVGTKEGALLVPQQAVSELQGNYEVAVVGPDNVAHIRPVKVGERYGTLWVIDEGLKPGERVVAEGVQKVKEGMKVAPKPFLEKPPEKPQNPAAARPPALPAPKVLGG